MIKIFTKVIFATAILALPSIPALAIDPMTEPFNPWDASTSRPNDPIIDNFQQIEDPSLGPSAPVNYGSGPM